MPLISERKGQIKPALFCFDAGDVTLPDLIWPIPRGHFSEPLLRYLVPALAVGSLRPEAALLPRTQALLAHELFDSILAATMTKVLKIKPDAQAAVGLAAFFKMAQRECRSPSRQYVCLSSRHLNICSILRPRYHFVVANGLSIAIVSCHDETDISHALCRRLLACLRPREPIAFAGHVRYERRAAGGGGR